ncbi:S8 family peptidase [bacterium BMS3Abin03]|jgi:serine protease AprX|nr:S8 family peptidase [bacterium BMS3Abin03]MCG6960619.1 S8 family peptidase [bacterium BMS3Abin03]
MKISVLLFIGIISLNFYAQSGNNKNTDQLNSLLKQSSDKTELLVWIFFNDKENPAVFKLENPEKFVSEKSLKRRSKVLPHDKLISNKDIPVNINYIKKVKKLGFRLKQKSRWFNGISGFATKQEIALISDLPFVKKIDVVEKFRKDYGAEIKDESNLPKKTISPQPEGIHNLNYGNSFTQLDQINIPSVQDLGYNGQGVTVCVMDAGFDNLSHEAFDSINIIAEWNFVDNSSDVSGHYHGTNTLSIIGGFKEGELIGPAFGSNYILAVTEDVSSETPVEEDNWIAAMEWADSIGVDVTSTSLGYLAFNAPYSSYTWEDMDGKTARITIAADHAASLGIIVVNSAGNNGFNSDHNTLDAPADGDSVFTIGAVTSSGIRSGFSSVGPTVDGRIKPDLMAMGSSVYAAGTSSLTSYGTVSGTSYACPLAAGCAALLLSYQPSLIPMEILNLFRQTASQSNNPDRLMGWGIIDTYAAFQLAPVVSVELTSFKGNYYDGSVQLEWFTSKETNNYGFEIQKRYDNTEFEKIGFVQGSNNTTEGNDYSFTDTDLLSYRIYYRLKQIDFNGKFKYSDVVMVEDPALNEFQLYRNYPNPFNPSTTISYSLPRQARIKIALYNILGNLVEILFDGEQTAGIHQLILNAKDLSSGVYFVSMVADHFNKSIKISLLK